MASALRLATSTSGGCRASPSRVVRPPPTLPARGPRPAAAAASSSAGAVGAGTPRLPTPPALPSAPLQGPWLIQAAVRAGMALLTLARTLVTRLASAAAAANPLAPHSPSSTPSVAERRAAVAAFHDASGAGAASSPPDPTALPPPDPHAAAVERAEKDLYDHVFTQLLRGSKQQG